MLERVSLSRHWGIELLSLRLGDVNQSDYALRCLTLSLDSTYKYPLHHGNLQVRLNSNAAFLSKK